MARSACEGVPVSDLVGEHSDQPDRGLRIRRQLAELADSIADTEGQVASTYEKIARHRSPNVPAGCGQRLRKPGHMRLATAACRRGTSAVIRTARHRTRIVR